MKDFEKMTFDELVEFCSWLFIQDFIKGEKLKSNIWKILELAVRWRVAQKDLGEKKWR